MQDSKAREDELRQHGDLMLLEEQTARRDAEAKAAKLQAKVLQESAKRAKASAPRTHTIALPFFQNGAKSRFETCFAPWR